MLTGPPAPVPWSRERTSLACCWGDVGFSRNLHRERMRGRRICPASLRKHERKFDSVKDFGCVRCIRYVTNCRRNSRVLAQHLNPHIPMIRYSDLKCRMTQKNSAPTYRIRWSHLQRLLYVIELDQSMTLNPVFLRANPHYIPGSPCYYVGSTSQAPAARFEEHKSCGRNASRIVGGFCKNLRMDLVPSAGKRFSRDRALEKEVRLARDLRTKGCGVWQA